MKMFKTVKFNSKKVAAVAVSATLAMCNASMGVLAGTLDFTETGTGSGAGDITGYQTTWEDYYAVNVTWGNLEFAYDKGNYDTQGGGLVRASDKDKFNGIEAGEDAEGTINRWYGFDGTNNKVEIENVSTVKVDVTTALSYSEKSGATKFTVYYAEGTNGDWKSTEESATATDINVSHSATG